MDSNCRDIISQRLSMDRSYLTSILIFMQRVRPKAPSRHSLFLLISSRRAQAIAQLVALHFFISPEMRAVRQRRRRKPFAAKKKKKKKGNREGADVDPQSPRGVCGITQPQKSRQMHGRAVFQLIFSRQWRKEATAVWPEFCRFV